MNEQEIAAKPSRSSKQADRHRVFLERMVANAKTPKARATAQAALDRAKQKMVQSQQSGGNKQLVADHHAGSGSIVVDGAGNSYMVMDQRNGVVNVVPVVNGKPVVSSDTRISFSLVPARVNASDNTRTEPLYHTGTVAQGYDRQVPEYYKTVAATEQAGVSAAPVIGAKLPSKDELYGNTVTVYHGSPNADIEFMDSKRGTGRQSFYPTA